MFGSTRRLQFLESLTSSRADEFSGQIQDAIRPASEMVSAVTENIPESPLDAVRDVPEMILAESTESIGEQLENQTGGSQTIQGIRQQASRIGRQSQSMFSQAAGQVEGALESVSGSSQSQAASPAREVMKRKLNHFQVERLAQDMKDRLEGELKIQKERWGEEP